MQLLSLLLPALIPSWRFFRDVGPSPRIDCRLIEPDGPWFDPMPRPQRVSLAQTVLSLVWNRRWNEYLYLISCAERLISEPTPFVEEELRQRLAACVDPHGAWGFAFRLRLITSTDREGEVVYMSGPIDFEEVTG